jgi:hypothetical protein
LFLSFACQCNIYATQRLVGNDYHLQKEGKGAGARGRKNPVGREEEEEWAIGGVSICHKTDRRSFESIGKGI